MRNLVRYNCILIGMGVGAKIESSNSERIREAALKGFAEEGVKATSIRDVAKAAGVSPGLVQHHYASKQALQEAVDQHVLAILLQAFTEIPEGGAEFFKEMGDQITAFVARQPLMMRYVARSIVEGEEASLRIFDAFVALSESHAERLRAEGFLREDADMLWVPLHLVMFNLACLLFEGALDRRLPAPFHTPEMLERWNRATTEMYMIGYSRRSDEQA
jgi:AcrR family transcriptional regulator